MTAITLFLMLLSLVCVALLTTGATEEEEPEETPFCAKQKSYPPFEPLSEAYAQEHRCCLSLPCEFDRGCWAGEMLPLYSSPRTRAFPKEQANFVEHHLLYPTIQAGKVHRKSNPSMPEYTWFQVQVPMPDEDPRFAFVYDGIVNAFEEAFHRKLIVVKPVDAFFIDDYFADKYSNDETYYSDTPGAGFWVHEDCNNYRLCHAEMGIPSEKFTGAGISFVVPLAVPHDRDFETDPLYQVTSLELYNISHGSMRNSTTGEEIPPPNRQWATTHGYNLGEIIWFHAFRYHSGHVPRTADFKDHENPKANRSEIVGFAAELTDGDWVLFRMCKGSTDDNVTEKLEPMAPPSVSSTLEERVVVGESREL